jgi:hypothetical protein
MLNDCPYFPLNLDSFPLIDTWAEKVESYDNVFLYTDRGGELLKPNLRELFVGLELGPIVCNLWSWKIGITPKYFHTDKTKTGVLLEGAINWFISGERGITEWSYKALEMPDGDAGTKNPFNKKYGNASNWWGGDNNLEADYSVVLDVPMLIKTQVPHRVNTLGCTGHRISYSVRFAENPKFDLIKTKLEKYIA